MDTSVNTRNNSTSSSYPLITKERTQKLELLNHLIANLAQAIVVCGPEGIGKTQLLKNFQESSTQSCMVCWVQGDGKLGFADIQAAISATIADNLSDLKSQSLSIALDRIHSRGAKVILVVDDAGNLSPGLIEETISYANTHPALRLVLALTHSQLYLKTSTDPALEDCYLVEIPALSEQQCEDYLDYLSTLSKPRIEFSAINEEKVAEVFRLTHGVPGSILTLLPEPVVKKVVDYSKSILLVSVVGLVLLALGVQWWTAHHPLPEDKVAQVKSAEQPAAGKPPTAVNGSPSATQNLPLVNGEPSSQASANSVSSAVQIPGEPSPTNTGLTQSNAGDSSSIEVGQPNSVTTTTVAKTADQLALGNASAGQSIPTSQDMTQTHAESGGNVNEGGHWLAAQPSTNYTLQLMAMSNEQVIIEVLQRYPELGEELRYIKTKTRRGRDRFILFYGSFTDPELIKAEKQKLPKELQKIWVRQIGDLQKDFNSTELTKTQVD